MRRLLLRGRRRRRGRPAAPRQLHLVCQHEPSKVWFALGVVYLCLRARASVPALGGTCSGKLCVQSCVPCALRALLQLVTHTPPRCFCPPLLWMWVVVFQRGGRRTRLGQAAGPVLTSIPARCRVQATGMGLTPSPGTFLWSEWGTGRGVKRPRRMSSSKRQSCTST